jgi:hypothetical protein
MAQRLVYHWKHGWIPLDHAAALSKAHGSQSGAARYLHHRPSEPTGKSNHAERRLQAQHSVAASPVGKDFRTMSPAQKIKAAEIMFGTNSPQHKAAQKRFAAKKPPKLPASASPRNKDSTFYGNPKYRSN